jgi:hypothetical protein
MVVGKDPFPAWETGHTLWSPFNERQRFLKAPQVFRGPAEVESYNC